jgi:hypothetical protein
MAPRATDPTARAPRVELPGARGRAPLLWTAPLVAVAIAHVALADASSRLQFLRAVLVVMALSEGAAAVAQVFFARRFGERNGRSYAPAYHGVVQDFGFYNLAMALLFALAALDPPRHGAVIAAGIVLYAVHGLTHVLRYLGLYYGGETPIATRPRGLELRDALALLGGLAGMVLFFP